MPINRLGEFHYDQPISKYFISNHQFDICDRRILNIRDPESSADAVNKRYLMRNCLTKNFERKIIDVNCYRITNVLPPLNDGDVVTLGFLKTFLSEKQLTPSDNPHTGDTHKIQFLIHPPTIQKQNEQVIQRKGGVDRGNPSAPKEELP